MNELTMELDGTSRTPLYEQIYNYIKGDIQCGKIEARQKLPSTRALASFLQVSRSTVDLAYEQLLSEGYIESAPYRGYFVCEIDALYRSNPSGQAQPVKEPKKEAESYRYDFSPNGIDLAHFPFNTWRKITRNTLIDDKKEMFQLGDPRGDESFREALCEYLYQSRGVKCSPEQIIIGAGNDYLLMLLSRFLGTDYLVAMENPTYKQAYRIFESLGFGVTTVNMDKSGMDVQKLQESRAQIAYVMPSHQYPLGVVMPMKRRMELLEWADGGDSRYIIEDDYDSEFRYVGKPIPALQGNDTKGRVIYIGTLSKSIAPAIRVSYMVLPERLLEAYEQYGSFISSTVSRIDQRILEEFLRGGYYERHLNRMRTIYKSKRDVLMEEMKKLSSICQVSGDRAGVHLLVRFTGNMTEKTAIRQAARVGIKVYGLSEYYIRPMKGSGSATVLMGYANLTEEEIREAVALLQTVWMEA